MELITLHEWAKTKSIVSDFKKEPTIDLKWIVILTFVLFLIFVVILRELDNYRTLIVEIANSNKYGDQDN